MNDKELSLVEQIYNKHNELAFSEILEFSVFSREPTFRHLQSLVKQGIIKKRQIGNLFLYSINYENPQTSAILSMIVNMQIKSMKINELIEDLSKKFINSPILFALVIPPNQIKKRKYATINIMIIYAGDKNNIFQMIQKIEKKFQYTSKFKISFSLYNIDEFLKHIKEDKHFLTGTVPFFNPERLFISLKYESQTFKIRV